MRHNPACRRLPGRLKECSRAWALLTFDEVKTGLTVGLAGHSSFGPRRTSSAWPSDWWRPLLWRGGSTQAVMSYVANGIYNMVGTFNGNRSRSRRAAPCWRRRDEEAYTKIGPFARDRPSAQRCDRRVRPTGSRRVDRAKGCVTFSTEPVRDYRDFLEIDDRYNHAHWLFQHNGGCSFLLGQDRTVARLGPARQLRRRPPPRQLERFARAVTASSAGETATKV